MHLRQVFSRHWIHLQMAAELCGHSSDVKNITYCKKSPTESRIPASMESHYPGPVRMIRLRRQVDPEPSSICLHIHISVEILLPRHWSVVTATWSKWCHPKRKLILWLIMTLKQEKPLRKALLQANYYCGRIYRSLSIYPAVALGKFMF